MAEARRRGGARKPYEETNQQVRDVSYEVAGRVPPQNLEAEVAALGALMLDAEAIIKVIDTLSPTDFYRPDHANIYEAMTILAEKRIPIDLITVADELARRGLLEQVGGPAMLSSLVNAVATASNVAHYAGIVREKAMLRRLIHAAAKIGDLGFREDEPSQEILDQAEQALFGVTQRFLKQNFTAVRSILAESFERLDALSKNESGIRGIPTGFKHLDGLLGGLQKSDLVILAARPSMGKCLTGDTRILDPETGLQLTIKEMVEGRVGTVATMRDDYTITASRPSDFIPNGIKSVATLKTALGHEITATYTHPFFTLRGWKQLSELKVGDRIAAPRALPFFGKFSIAPHEVKALAYFVADGSVVQSSPRFTNGNIGIMSDFSGAMRAFGKGIEVKQVGTGSFSAPTLSVVTSRSWYMQQVGRWSEQFNEVLAGSLAQVTNALALSGASTSLAYGWRAGKTMPSSALAEQIRSKVPGFPRPTAKAGENRVTEFLRSHGLWGMTAHYKQVPETVFMLEKEQVALFLNRLFSCDGTAYVSNGQPCIAYASASKYLVQDIQHLLLRFGIIAKIREKQVKYRGGHKRAFELEIHGRKDLITFADQIGIFGKEEEIAIVRATAIARKVGGYTKDTLPIEIWDQIIAKKGAKSWRSLAIAMGLPESHNFHVGKRAPTRASVKRFAEVLQDSDLLNLSKSDLFWDTIVSVADAGEQEVYDLTIPETHNFVANDLVVHNSTFALCLAENAAIHHKSTVGLFSLEMSKEQLVDKLISSIGRIDSWKLRNGKLNDDDFRKLNEAYGILAEANIFIDDGAGQTVNEVRAKARRLQAEAGLDLIIIDYLQLMTAPGFGADNRVQEVSEISRSLKALAKELNVPVIALSQLSRAVESRPDKRPMLSDLRESGSIEQDADVVIFLYRDDYYNKEEQNHITDVLVRKHRNGPTGDIKVLSRLQFSRFENLDLQHMGAEASHE